MTTLDNISMGSPSATARRRFTFEALMAHPHRLSLALRAASVVAVLYAVAYVLLSRGGGYPSSFTPWLRIDAADYYRWDALMVAPSMLGGLVLAAGVVQLLARGRGTFEDTLAALAIGVAVATCFTLTHDLIVGTLGTVGVIDGAAYERAMNEPTVWRALIWTLMSAYAVTLIGLFVFGVAAAQRLSLARAAPLALAGVAAYQLVFVIFNR